MNTQKDLVRAWAKMELNSCYGNGISKTHTEYKELIAIINGRLLKDAIKNIKERKNNLL